jgi:endoglucanase
MENRYHVPEGLQKQSLDAILGRVKSLGFNAIRLTFSNATIESNPVITRHVDANPQLKGLHALEILDRIVAAAGQHGLRIILDDSRSSMGGTPEPDGLWYTKQYPERSWIADWKMLVSRYNGNPTVVAVDLRNEPHTRPPGPWSLKTYLHQGATWGPYKGKDDKATDWILAAERAGNAVLAINPHLLIIVEGIQQYPDPKLPGGIDASWWGSILQPARRYPVELAVPHQLVYSPHEYGPFKYQMPQFGPRMSYVGVTAVWEKHWAFLLDGGSKTETPIFLGEFGTCGSSARCVSDTAPGSQGLWFSFLLRFLQAHPEVGWAFWALNGTNPDGVVMPNYVLKPDWKTARLPALMQALHQVEGSSCSAT